MSLKIFIVMKILRNLITIVQKHQEILLVSQAVPPLSVTMIH